MTGAQTSYQPTAKLMVTWVDRELGKCTQSLFAYGKIVSDMAWHGMAWHGMAWQK